jgi:hypothetical protein
MGDEIFSNAVFTRIRELYRLDSDAAMARRLGIFPQDVPRQRKSGNLPYKQILNACPPGDWEFIFTGRRPPERSEGPITFEASMEYLASLGYRVTLEKKA